MRELEREGREREREREIEGACGWEQGWKLFRDSVVLLSRWLLVSYYPIVKVIAHIVLCVERISIGTVIHSVCVCLHAALTQYIMRVH